MHVPSLDSVAMGWLIRTGVGYESIKNLGVGRSGFRFELQIWMPPVEDRAEFLIESFHPRLQ
jgi:hypothetical protein